MKTKVFSPIKVLHKRNQQGEHFSQQIQDLLQTLLRGSPALLQAARSPYSENASLQLPILVWEELGGNALCVSFLWKQRVGAIPFFYEMLTNWLLPGRCLASPEFFSSDVYLPDIASPLLTIGQIFLTIHFPRDGAVWERQRKKVDQEIRLGVASNYHAQQILSFKDLSSGEKTEMLQRHMGSFIKTQPEDYNKSVLAQMQRFWVMSREAFKNERSYEHMSRIIALLHISRKILHKKRALCASKRHVVVKLLKARLEVPQDTPHVLGVIVGLHFTQEQEVFQQKHFRTAIAYVDPFFEPVPDSFLVDRNQNSSIQLSYLEVKKRGKEPVAKEDIEHLREHLPDALCRHIEYLAHPLFMPRNEEEVLRNIMVLAKQLKYVQDIPQVIINFEQQKEALLVFTVVLLRIVRPGQKEVGTLLEELPRTWSCRLERSKKVGTLRRRYAKEAHVFSVKIPSCSYLQEGYYVDFYQARAALLQQLHRIFGEVRDYNGGMIGKHTEILEECKKSLGEEHRKSYFFFEKLFFSLQPSEMRSLLYCSLLKTLFFAILEQKQQKKQPTLWSVKNERKKAVFVSLQTDPKYRKVIWSRVQQEQYRSCELLSFFLEDCFGFILLSEEESKKEALERILDSTPLSCQS